MTFDFKFTTPSPAPTGNSIIPVSRLHFGTGFQSGVNNAVIISSLPNPNITASFLAVAPLAVSNTISNINSFDIDESNLSMATQLINYVVSCVNPASFFGSRPPYNGAATMVSIW